MATGLYASVTGGRFNNATGNYASVSGGQTNTRCPSDSVGGMSDIVVEDRMATHSELLRRAPAIRRLAAAHGFNRPRLRSDGSVIVHSEEPGYRTVNRLSTEASQVVGAYVHVLTDDVPGAVDTTPL